MFMISMPTIRFVTVKELDNLNSIQVALKQANFDFQIDDILTNMLLFKTYEDRDKAVAYLRGKFSHLVD